MVILGFGNSFRGDDAVGFDAARRLSALAYPASVHVHAGTQLTPELAELVAHSRLVIFVDASIGEQPGVVTCKRLDPPSPWRGSYVHHLDPAGLLDFAGQCFGKAPPAYVFSVGGEFFGYRHGLSEVVTRAEDELIARVTALIAWWQGRIADCADAHCDGVAHA